MKNFFIFQLMFLLITSGTFAQVIINEDFSTATGTTPPTGWTSTDVAGTGFDWAFNNPGGQTLVSPISDPAAIFDSDYYGGGSVSEENTLETPTIDASNLSETFYLSFDHYYDGYSNSAYYIEVYNGTTWTSVISGSGNNSTTNPQHESVDITAELAGSANGKVRFRWTGDDAWYWVVDNVKIEKTTCPPISALTLDSVSTTTASVSWTANGSEISWEIQWGPVGFQPGTNTETGSATATTTDYTITGLSSSTDYDIYVNAGCSGYSIWVKVSATTDCAPFTLPWYENFDAMTQVDYDLFPNCWLSENGDWMSDNGYNIWNGTAYSNSNYLAITYNSSDYLWTPPFQLDAGKTYEFSFYYKGDGYNSWTGELYVSNDQNSSSATLVDAFLSSTETTVESYIKKTFCFTPGATDIYSFGVYVSAGWNPYNLEFDDFSLIERGATAGTNGSENVCQTTGLVNLSSVAQIDDTLGTWNFDLNPNAIVNDSMFNPVTLQANTYNVSFITTGCLVDTVVATLHIYAPSSAGDDGLLTACLNQPSDLYSALTGTVDHSGTWYNSAYQPVSSLTTAPSIPGSYNYYYIAGNGICPDDTANVLLTVVSTCNYLNVEDLQFGNMVIYPNPSTGLVYISNNGSADVYSYSVIDAQGRVITTSENTINGNNTTMINLSDKTTGIYMIRVYNNNAEKVYRVVIQ